MVAVQKSKWIIFGLLLMLIISGNTLIYQLDALQPLPKEIALATLLDFLIVIPAITYFFIIRKRYSLKYLLPVAFAGYGAAWLIIPQGFLSSYSFVKYILFAGEGVFIFVELYVIYKLITKLPVIIQSFRNNENEVLFFQHRLEQAFQQHGKASRLLDIITSEITMFYYSLFCWRKNVSLDERMFTTHKKSGVITFYVMVIHALLLESVGFHFLLHSWSPVVAIIALLLNGYTLLLLIGEIQAIRLCPIMMTDDQLHLQIGIMKRLTVPLDEIKEITYYEGPEKLSKQEQKITFDGVHADFMKEKPIFEIEFHRPLEAKLLYGFTKKVTKAHLRPDEPSEFYNVLVRKIASDKGERKS